MTDNFERTPGGAVLMDGIRLRGEIIASLRTTIEAAGSPSVCLATVLVGDDKPSQLYVASKRKLAGEAGMVSKHVGLPADASQAEVEAAVAALVAAPTAARVEPRGVPPSTPLPRAGVTVLQI